MKKHYSLIILSLFLIMAMTACGKGNSTAASTREEGGGDEFQPLPDGFGFRNYGVGYPEGDLTINEVRRMFGDDVCAWIENEGCIPTPEAQLWIQSMNRYMQSGHCEGFTVLSYRFFTGQLVQAEYEPEAGTTYDLSQQEKLMKEIALNFTYQVLEEVWHSTVEGTPAEIVNNLLEADWPVNLGIFSPDGRGHSLLAYGIEDTGNGVFHILAYDNNAPGQAVYIEIDINANTWKFMPPELAPSSQAENWQGDAGSFSLNYTPLAAYDQPVACPFCLEDESGMKVRSGLASQSDQPGSSRYVYVILNGSSEIQVTDENGQRVGISDGAIINEISDARLFRVRGGLAGDGVLIALPRRDLQHLAMLLPGTNPATDVDLRTYSTGLTFAVDGLNLQAGQNEQVNISMSDRSVEYIAGGTEKPAVKLAVQAGDEHYLVLLNNADMQAGESIGMNLEPGTGLLNVTASGLQDPMLSLAFARTGPQGSQIFANNGINISPDGTATLDIFRWNGEPTLNETIDSESDDKTMLDVSLKDQPLLATFSSNFTADEILNSYQEFAPYMDEMENELMPYFLANYHFDGSQLGRIFHAFDNFMMEPPAVAEYLSSTIACPGNISLFLFEQHMPESGKGSITEWINLFPQEYAQYLPELMTELKLTNEALIEGTFQGFSGEELNTFIGSYVDEHMLALETQAPLNPQSTP